MSDLNCDEFVELVTAFLDDALDSDGEQRFVDHLATCEGCERYLGQVRQTIRTLGDLPAERLSSATRDALLAELRDQRD